MVKLNPGDKICIVGGGTTGLYVLKACLEHNLIPTVFEAADSVGGVWRSKGPGGLAYDSLHTNSSSLLTCASDFPFSPTSTKTWHPAAFEICEHLEKYCDHYDLRKYIKFGYRVEKVIHQPLSNYYDEHSEYDDEKNEMWNVQVMSSKHHNNNNNNIVEKYTFDAVFICSGQYGTHVNMPTFKNSNIFKGKIIHSQTYRSPSEGDDKNVVILGMGNSSLDIAFDMAERSNAKEILHCARNGSFMTAVGSGNESIPPGDVTFHSKLINVYILYILYILPLYNYTNNTHTHTFIYIYMYSCKYVISNHI